MHMGQVTEVFSWLGDQEPIKMATSDHLPVIQEPQIAFCLIWAPHCGILWW